MKRNFKRVFVASDSHCGHRVGLTPTPYQGHGDSKWEQLQFSLWSWFKTEVEKHKPYDIAILNGDLIDGKGFRSGGSELITADRMMQARIAFDAFRIVEAQKVRIIAGTPYHSGTEEDFEQRIMDLYLADGIDCAFHGHGFYTINGRNLDVKHKISSSSVHHGRATPLLKEIDANLFWAMDDVEPMADIVIRGHVHYHLQTEQDGRYGFILPSLQGLGDKYGSRQCSNRVDFGFLVLDIPENVEDKIEWTYRILPGIVQRTEAEVL
jgi:hypothetical protein